MCVFHWTNCKNYFCCCRLIRMLIRSTLQVQASLGWRTLPSHSRSTKMLVFSSGASRRKMILWCRSQVSYVIVTAHVVGFACFVFSILNWTVLRKWTIPSSVKFLVTNLKLLIIYIWAHSKDQNALANLAKGMTLV